MIRGEETQVECPECHGTAFYRPLYETIHMPGNENEPAENVELHPGFEVECPHCGLVEGEPPEL